MPVAKKKAKYPAKYSSCEVSGQVCPCLPTTTTDDSISTNLAIIVQDLQMLERRLSPTLPANRAVADEIGISLESLHEYLKRRDVFNFIVAMRRASRRMSRSLVCPDVLDE